MAILTKAGRTAIAEAMKAEALHLAWGPGDGTWTSAPAEDANATALTGEIGRRLVTSVEYVVPDSAGDIEIAGVGLFSLSVTPTNRLLVTTQFDFADAPTAVIRQIGLFVGTVTDSGLPAGQRYFAPGDITSPGRLLQLENRSPIYRSSGTRERFEILLAF